VNIHIQQCDFEEIKHFSRLARKERSILSHGPHHQWYLATLEGEIVGCSCAWRMGKGQGRIKGTFVSPRSRGLGISKRLNDACLEQLQDDLSITHITAFVTTERNLAWYLKNGFMVQRESDGIAFVKKLL